MEWEGIKVGWGGCGLRWWFQVAWGDCDIYVN